jgi:hypothetical protein
MQRGQCGCLRVERLVLAWGEYAQHGRENGLCELGCAQAGDCTRLALHEGLACSQDLDEDRWLWCGCAKFRT